MLAQCLPLVKPPSLYTGGHDGEGLLDTVERYDPHRDTWTIVTTLGSPCCLGALVALKGCLYAIGGYDGASVLQSLRVSSSASTLRNEQCK
jgi:hypothetical protein